MLSKYPSRRLLFFFLCRSGPSPPPISPKSLGLNTKEAAPIKRGHLMSEWVGQGRGLGVVKGGLASGRGWGWGKGVAGGVSRERRVTFVYFIDIAIYCISPQTTERKRGGWLGKCDRKNRENWREKKHGQKGVENLKRIPPISLPPKFR